MENYREYIYKDIYREYIYGYIYGWKIIGNT